MPYKASQPGPGADGDVLAGRRPILELLGHKRSANRILVAEGISPSSVVAEVRRRAQHAGIPVKTVSRTELNGLAPAINHQGLVAIVPRYRYEPYDRLLAARPSALLFIDGVMDPHNLGSLIRSAAVAGIGGVVIRAHRAAAVTATVRRVSAGAAEFVPVARVANMAQSLEQARGAGLWVVGVDERAEVVLWSSHLMEPPVGLVLGAEDRGLSRVVRDHCDGFVRIPPHGSLESLNVAVAGAVAMFEVARRRAGEQNRQ
jgi:23S rRNA (guanosine2251-2'-O)-methyltransferase